jgi:hypothetical protein
MEKPMSYQEAIKSFTDSLRRCDAQFVDANLKPFLWNLNKGLNSLAVALEKDMSEIHARLDLLEKGEQRSK